MFFDFLNDFVFIYRNTIKDKIIGIVRVLVQRCRSEQEMMANSEQKNNYIINQSWNVLRYICETKEYIPAYLERIEEEMKPILEYAAEPEKIDFDDDIALLISTSIKLSQRLTEIQKTIFRCFEAIHGKYKGIFGNLLNCLNMYVVYNDGWLDENQEAVKSMYNMATKSLFYDNKKDFMTTTS